MTGQMILQISIQQTQDTMVEQHSTTSIKRDVVRVNMCSRIYFAASNSTIYQLVTYMHYIYTRQRATASM